MCFLVAAGCVLYGRTLTYPFAFDCWTFIQNNPLIKDLKYYSLLTDINALKLLDKQLGLPNDVATGFLLRPLLNITFSANYLVQGLNPAGFRAVNIALHIFNALLLFLFLERLLGRFRSADGADGFSVRFIPTLSAALFLLHPLQTESVTYIIQRSNTLMTSFCLGSLLLYHRFVNEQNHVRALVFRWGSAALLLCGMFVEESMVTVPLLLLLLETVCLGSSLKSALQRTLPHLCLMPVVPLLVLAAGNLQRGAPGEGSGLMNVLNYSGYSPFQYAVTQLCVIATYLRQLLFPYGQNVDPDYPLYTSLFQGRPLAALTLLTLVFFMPILIFLRRRNDYRSSLLLFGAGWFFLGLSASSGIVPLPDLMAESRVYCSSIGFFTVLALLLDWLQGMCRAPAARQWIVMAAVVLVAGYGTAAWARNGVWSSNIRLWTDAAAKSPKKARTWHNLGMAYLDEGRYEDAIVCFKSALVQNPKYMLSYEALVVAYTRTGRPDEAQNSAIAGLEIAPRNAVLHNNLGVIYAENGRPEKAREHFEMALQFKPSYDSARMNLERLSSSQVQ